MARDKCPKCKRYWQYCNCAEIAERKREARERSRRSYGSRWTGPDGTTHTVNPADDPRASGGYYHSQTDSDGTKSTTVHNPDGSFVPGNVGNNRDYS
jgi:hypothetical protein